MKSHIAILSIIAAASVFGAAVADAGYRDEVTNDSPVVYYRFGEPSGTTAASEIDSPAKDAVYVNVPTLGVQGLQLSDNDTSAGTIR